VARPTRHPGARDPRDTEVSADDAATETKDKPASARIRLHERLGLRTPPDLIQTAVLDYGPAIPPRRNAAFRGLRRRFQPVGDQPRTIVILENKETGYAITDDHAGNVVLHGHGFSVVNYARITWARNPVYR
jgi:hypothetical protein